MHTEFCRNMATLVGYPPSLFMKRTILYKLVHDMWNAERQLRPFSCTTINYVNYSHHVLWSGFPQAGRAHLNSAHTLTCTTWTIIFSHLVHFTYNYSGSLKENLYRGHHNCQIILSYGCCAEFVAKIQSALVGTEATWLSLIHALKVLSQLGP